MNNLKISIITICFNAEKTIVDTVKSVVEQSYPNIEYIIVDGASKDNTLTVIKPFADKIAKIISEPDKGLYDALNKGLKAATGDIIGLLHSDDFYANKGVIEHLIKLFNEHSDLDCISSSINIFKDNAFEKPYRVYNATTFKPWQFGLGMQPPHPGFFLKEPYFLK